jgi:hypothetical protein
MGVKQDPGNQTRLPDIYRGMEPTWRRASAEPDVPLVRLGPSAWWTLLVAAALTVALVIAPLTALVLSHNLDDEVGSTPEATFPGAGQPAAGPSG